jgi:anti-sigma-K factor RskA
LTSGAHIREEDLQLLALGALPEAEALLALAHTEGCAECAAKLAEERGLAGVLAFTATQEKPAGTIKAELFARIRSERVAEERFRWPSKTDSGWLVEAPKVKGEERRLPKAEKAGWWQWVLAPVATVLLLSTVLEWRENQRLKSELVQANHQLVDLVKEKQRSAALVDALAAPETLSVKMVATPEAEKAIGVVRYNPQKGMVLYTAVLPPLPPDKVYQMWLVPASGAPISAGVFTPGEQGARQFWTAEVPLNTEVKAFAVTIEPAGGVPQPTGPKVLLGTS